MTKDGNSCCTAVWVRFQPAPYTVLTRTATSKVFETFFLTRLLDETGNNKYQFSLKAGHSTALCTSAFKRTVEY